MGRRKVGQRLVGRRAFRGGLFRPVFSLAWFAAGWLGCSGGAPTDCPARADEVCIKAGSFTMGAEVIPFAPLRFMSPAGGACVPGPENHCAFDHAPGPRNDFAPPHVVTLSSFMLQKNKVTNAAYGQCVSAGVCPSPKLAGAASSSATAPSFSQAPVVAIPWTAARDYCVWRGGRLPTEAEYERAARGLRGTSYPWGDGQLPAGFAQTGQPPFPNVGTNAFDVTPEGIQELWVLPREWMQDWYDPDFYTSPAASRDPAGPPIATRGTKHCCADNGWRQHFAWQRAKTVRGAGFGNPSGGREWADTGQAAPAWFRDFANPEGSYSDIGFRCVRDFPSKVSAPFPVYRDLEWRAVGRGGGQ